MELQEQILKFKDFFEECYLPKLVDNARMGKKRITIEFNDLARFDIELANNLIDNPDETFEAAESAISEFDLPTKKIKMRVRGELPNSKIRIRELRAAHLGKFITVEGIIETKTDVNVKMVSIKYECPSCGNVIDTLQRGDEVAEPTKCGCGRKGHFIMLSKNMMDCYTLRVQELSSSIKYGADMKIKSVLCEDDLTDVVIEEKLIEGQRVAINGTYKEKILVKGKRKQTQLVTYIEANYIQISNESFYDIELTQKDVEAIRHFSKQPYLIEKMYDGLFQGVYGYDKIKEALLLQSFGGISLYDSIPPIRGDIHVLLVGDPGENKSAFINFASSFNPKSVQVVGKSVSAVGLSGAVIKDELSGSFVLKPGAIPLANNGLIAIDELDKMKIEDRDILHEPMENQTVSISKANLADRKMLARESFLVSMNPKNGYFNEFDPVYGQIDLPPTLVSRFDLVFIMRKNRIKDDKVRQAEKEKARIMMTRGKPELQKKLKEFHTFMRKYIAYAKQNIRPEFDKYLEEEYLPEKFAGFDHERKNNEAHSFPITPRFIWVIRRLAEAHRRAMLGTKCTQEDVDYAIERIRGSLEDIAVDVETGKLDVEWISDGVPGKTKKMLEVFDDVFESVKMATGDVMMEDFFNKMREGGFKDHDIEELIEQKRKYGDVFFPRNNIMRRL